jgi:hypothetical protein
MACFTAFDIGNCGCQPPGQVACGCSNVPNTLHLSDSGPGISGVTLTWNGTAWVGSTTVTFRGLTSCITYAGKTITIVYTLQADCTLIQTITGTITPIRCWCPSDETTCGPSPSYNYDTITCNPFNWVKALSTPFMASGVQSSFYSEYASATTWTITQ